MSDAQVETSIINKDKRNMCGKVNELKTLNESLHKEKVAQDRELKKLRREIQQYEQMIMNLKSEISLTKYCTPNVSKKDAEVMAGMCCTGAECGDWEPVKDSNSVAHEEIVSFQERIQKMEVNLKCSNGEVRTLRKANVCLREQLHALRGACAALGEQCRAAALRSQFKDDIIREMRRQLKNAKTKWETCDVTTSTTNVQTSTPNVQTSTPNVSFARNLVDFAQSSEVSIIETPVQATVLIPSDSEEAVMSSSRDAQCALRCRPVRGCTPKKPSVTCASKCKHLADCFTAHSADKCAYMCKHVPDCDKRVSRQKCTHVPQCTPSQAVGTCAMRWKLAKDRAQSQTSGCSQVPECNPGRVVGTCAMKCIHDSDCAQRHRRDTCLSNCKHSLDCSQASCPSKCEHVEDCREGKSIACTLNCSHVPKCTPGKAVGICALNCIHVLGCAEGRKRVTPDCDQAICAMRCTHAPECTHRQRLGTCALESINNHDSAIDQKSDTSTCEQRIKSVHVNHSSQNRSNVSCSLNCSHVPECSPGRGVGLCSLKCIHIQDCPQVEERDSCSSKCKHSLDSNIALCRLKCIHAADCTQPCATKYGHAESCSKSQQQDSCKSKCNQSVDICASKCSHVKGCTEAQPKGPCSSSVRSSTNKDPCWDQTGTSAMSGLENHLVGKCARALQSLSAIALSKSSPKIKTEPRCVSFDIDIKESVGTSSAPDSPSAGSCASARAHYYQSKLLATLQILQNKEETVRVQAESLAVAESRIACLTSRSAELKRELERKGRELQALRKALEERRAEQCDASITTQLQEMENQENIVNTLQNNLSIIEELYRECFYETVKQDNLIDMLRESYSDVRLMDREKSNQITKLHNIIIAQKWSLDKCEDIATEVNNLKTEISNFLNSSNNDSGMWEESFAGGVNEDLQDIAAQLLRLRELLAGDCTCGLEEENTRLKQENDVLEIEIGDLRIRITELEVHLVNTEKISRRYQEQIEDKDKELDGVRGQLTSLERECEELRSNNEKLTCQLARTQVVLEEKFSELSKVRRQGEAYENTIRTLKEELDNSEQIARENESLSAEVSAARRRAAREQQRALALEVELTRARERCQHVTERYREAASGAAELEARLDEAHGRGAELCGEAARVVRSVRGWVAHMKDIHREQEEQMKRKESQMRCLQQRLQQNDLPTRICHCQKHCSTRQSTNSSIGTERRRCVTAASASEMEPTCSKRLERNDGSFKSACDCLRERQEPVPCTSASEMGSYSSAPVRPKRTLKKKSSPCVSRQRGHGWWPPAAAAARRCEAAVQRPERCDAAVCSDVTTRLAHVSPRPHLHSRPAPALRPASPVEEMFSRIESMSAALADSYRRWTAGAPAPP